MIEQTSEQILKSLHSGGLTIANRQTGKTTAIMKYADELGSDSVIIVVPAASVADRIRKIWARDFSSPCPMLTDARGVENAARMVQSTKILVDEYFSCGYRGPFHAAVASVPFLITVVGGDN